MARAVDEQRKVLDQLMGQEGIRSGERRRYHKSNYNHNDIELQDARVCKAYLVGECPFDLFIGTKQSMGNCPQLHLTKHKLQYEALKKEGKEFLEFEREYFVVLSKFVNDCNGLIQSALKNLEHTVEEKERIKQVTEELDILDSKIGLMDQEIECLMHTNEVTKAMAQSVKLEEFRKQRKLLAAKVRSITENVGQMAQQKLQVCEVCGAYLSRLDTDRRLADHFLGKIHIGYLKMREQLDILKQKQKYRLR
ncbi:hypothetical protein TPHA_0C03800 [Tetrapisispora phaffii CBS 4417]|uniref:Uncharacterized protein n=1 Tax=Tetrapisispora phaffii (strain ATCC 24235 / CBS 4417 / NBRC 1672 / NRRL Y-8282 / UCD 70-5) TaxID=1071381 RepID=G8BQM0_TETPH|nr:hypothetical protein TPHA_0C03800 [Tetrapisispora phaffii CBS 4417]CCE62532.1 hypothetical protein TPHA_0C03800 [Tetrapisispora phaffii CBS 4417]